MSSSSFIKVIVNNSLDSFFQKHNIYTHKQGKKRFKDGQFLLFRKDSVIEPYVTIVEGKTLVSMGSFSYTNSSIPKAVIRIGRYCSLAPNLQMMGAIHPLDRLSTSTCSYDSDFKMYQDYLLSVSENKYHFVKMVEKKPSRIIIENDVWVGANVILNRGITLGTGCVVGTNALVTKDVPPYAIVGGIPAKVIKYRFSEPVIERLLASQWWQYGFDVFGQNQAFMDPIKVLDLLERKRDEGTLQPFTPEPVVADEGLLERIYGNHIPQQLLPL
jgi:acetyltransferase-like isoleucine patch superfamily enzyme